MRYMVIDRTTESVWQDTTDRSEAFEYCGKLNGPHRRRFVVRSYFTDTLGV